MVSVRGRSVTEFMASTGITEVAANLVDDVVNPCTFSSAAVPHWADVLVPSPSIPVTEAQWGTIEPHLPRGSLQAGGARVSNRDLRRGDPPVLTTGARRRDSLRRMSPLIDLLTAPGPGRGCDPPALVGRLSRRCTTAAAGCSQRTRSRVARLPRQKGTADVGMTTRGKASKGMVVVDGDGIMFGARWYALTPCGTRSPFGALCREEEFQPSLESLAGGMNLPGNVLIASNRS